MIWWLFMPQYFPFFKNQVLERFSLFSFNLSFWFVSLIFLGLSNENYNLGPNNDIGIFAGFGVIFWLIVRGIGLGRHRLSKAGANTKKAKRIKDTEKPTRPANVPKAPQPQKPPLKEDFELADDHNICQMQYKNSKGEISDRPILIRKLKMSDQGNWFVSAVDIEAKRLKSFRVDRIISLSHNNQTWTSYNDILGIIRTFETLI